MTPAQRADESFIQSVLYQMHADLATHVAAIREAGYVQVADYLLLNFFAWGLSKELERRVDTPSGRMQVDAIMQVLRAAVNAAAQGYPDPTPTATH
jgi:hypothetical protein